MQVTKRLRVLVAGFALSGLVGMSGAWASSSEPPDPDLQTYVDELLEFLKDLQDSVYDTVAVDYDSQLADLYAGQQTGSSGHVGALKLPDTFAIGLSISQDTGQNPYNLGPFAPRSRMRSLIGRETNRALIRATQAERLSEAGQDLIKANNDKLQTKLQDAANRGIAYANTAAAATSTQDALKEMNQQLALVNSSIVSTSLESLKLQTNFVGEMGNLEMLVSDVGEALDEQVREQYYRRSQQALSTAMAAFAAGESLAWKPQNYVLPTQPSI